MAGHKFRPRIHAAQQAVKVWICEACGTWHNKGKPKVCNHCGDGAHILYFASTGEARRYASLRMLQDYGKVSGLRVQVPFPVYANGQAISRHKIGKPVFTYYADFVYDREDGRQVVEDFKGSEKGALDVFRLKRKIIEPLYGIIITITEG